MSRSLDELDERETAHAEVVVFARGSGAGQRLVVAAESVVQDGGEVARPERSPRPSPRRFAFDSAQAKRFCTFASSPRHDVEQDRGVPQRRVAGCGGDRVGLFDQGSSSAELSGVDVHAGAIRQGDRKLFERSRVT